MATGDTNDVINRLQAALPPWFPDLASSPILAALLTGMADAFATTYNFLSFAALQTRLKTMSGGWLDLFAWDFFAGRFVRRFGETDPSWQPRIQGEITRPRQTRAAIIRMLLDLTGRTPQVFEAFSTGDFGSYGTGTMGYGYGKGYGSLQYPNQVFINAFRTPAQGIPFVSGYGMKGGGYGVGLFGYIDLSLISGPITDAEINADVAATVAAGVTAWLDLLSGVPVNTARQVARFNSSLNSGYLGAI